MGKHVTRSRGSAPTVSVHFDGDNVPKQACEGRTDLTAVTFKEGVQSVGYCALRGCTSIRELRLPKSTRSVGRWAFCDCKGLESIHLNEGLEELEDNAARGCTSLTDIEIPASVNVVGKSAFELCQNLKEVRILGSPEFGKNAFARCENLEGILLKAKDSSQIEHVIPEFMRRVEEADGDWTIVYERIKGIKGDENQDSSAKTPKKRSKTKQRSASKGSTDDAPQLSSTMLELRHRAIKGLDKELSFVDKEHKKCLKNLHKLLKEACMERDDLKLEVERLRQTNKDMATKLQKNRGVGDIEMLPKTNDLQDNVEGLQERLEQQRKDNADLRKDKEDMRKDKDDLREQLKALQRENDKLTVEREKKGELIETMKAENGELEVKLQQVTKQYDESRSQIINSNVMGSGNPETPKRSHDELQCAENEGESTVEKARKKKRMNEVEVQTRMEEIMDGLQG